MPRALDGKLKQRAIGWGVCHWINWRICADAETPLAGASGRKLNDINAPSASHLSYSRPKPLLMLLQYDNYMS